MQRRIIFYIIIMYILFKIINLHILLSYTYYHTLNINKLEMNANKRFDLEENAFMSRHA